MNNLAILFAIATAADFAALQKWAADESVKLAEADKAEAQAVAEADAAQAAEAQAQEDAHAAAIADFDPANVTPAMAVALGLTNGMPEWLILQKYAAWKIAQDVAS